MPQRNCGARMIPVEELASVATAELRCNFACGGLYYELRVNGALAQASRVRTTVQDGGSTRETRIYIVDLAGSERSGLYALDQDLSTAL